jgi:hypothetical protein
MSKPQHADAPRLITGIPFVMRHFPEIHQIDSDSPQLLPSLELFHHRSGAT